MRIEIATLFPEMCEAVLGESIVGRARKADKIQVHCRQIRELMILPMAEEWAWSCSASLFTTVTRLFVTNLVQNRIQYICLRKAKS